MCPLAAATATRRVFDDLVVVLLVLGRAKHGNSLQFTATGTFDSDDNIASGNEQTIDITPYVGWATLVDNGPESAFNIDVGTGKLETPSAVAGNKIRVSAEFPAGNDHPQLNDNLKVTSPFFVVNVT